MFSKCQSIREYMIFVDKVRRYSEEKTLEKAINQAIEECLKENVMADFLKKNKSEVMKVCLYEYDEEKQREWDREEGRAEGRVEGRAEGRVEGRAEGKELEQKAIVEYMTAKGDYTREAIAAITGIPLETIEEILEAVGAVEAPATKAE